MREEKGVIDLMKAMETHEKEASVIDFACSALWGLSLEGNQITYSFYVLHFTSVMFQYNSKLTFI